MNNTFLKKTRSCLAMLACSVLLLSACGSPPKREPYAGADLIGEISPQSLVGQWKVTILNPIAEENDMTIDYVFNRDGSVIANIIPSAEQNENLGDMQYRATGSWQTQGDLIVLTHNKMEETTGNKFGGIMMAIVNAFASKSGGEVNPYEISSNRMIWVHNESGEARLLERI